MEIQAGEALPPIPASTLDGVPTFVPVSGDLPTVLYVFSPECGWCSKNRENVIWLESKLRGRYRFVGISLTARGLREHMKEQPLPFPVYQNPSPGALAAYRLESTPQTILISRNGEFERAWSGAYVDDLKLEIQAYLTARL